MNAQLNRKNQSEGGVTQESFVNVSDQAKVDGSLQESLLLQGSLEEELEEEFSLGSSVYKAPDLQARQVTVPPSRLEMLRQEQAKAGVLGESNSSAPTSLNQSFNQFALTAKKGAGVFDQSNIPSFDLGNSSKMFSASSAYNRASGVSPMVFNYQQRQAANGPEESDASRSQSPDVLPGYPKINTQGMNTIRNMSDDEDITLRHHGGPGEGDTVIQEEFKQESVDHTMTQLNPKKRGRQELEQQHEEFQQNYHQWNAQQAAIFDSRERDRVMRDHRQHPNNEMVIVSRAQLSGKMKSKADIYKILTKEGQFYLPPIDDCPMIFIKDLLMGKKKVIKNSQIAIIDVPYFEEMTAKRIMYEIRGSNIFNMYLPDIDVSSKKTLNRQYLFNIVNTLDPEFFPENIKDAYRQRKERHEDRGNEKMQMNAELFDLIQGSNQIIHNRGRALAYMGNADKKRKLGNDEDGQGVAVQRVRHEYKPARQLGSNFSGSGFFQSGIDPNQHHQARRNPNQLPIGGARVPQLTPISIMDHINNMGVNNMSNVQ